MEASSKFIWKKSRYIRDDDDDDDDENAFSSNSSDDILQHEFLRKYLRFVMIWMSLGEEYDYDNVKEGVNIRTKIEGIREAVRVY